MTLIRIGKAEREPPAINAIKRHKAAVYVIAVGGALFRSRYAPLAPSLTRSSE